MLAATLALTASALPAVTTGSSYSTTVAATGGTLPYTFTVTSGSLGPLSLNSSTGTITGTAPATVQMLQFMVTVTDNVGATAIQGFSINVGQVGSVVTGCTFPTGRDQYGGIIAQHNATEALKAYPHTAKIGTHWQFFDALGNPVIIKALDSMYLDAGFEGYTRYNEAYNLLMKGKYAIGVGPQDGFTDPSQRWAYWERCKAIAAGMNTAGFSGADPVTESWLIPSSGFATVPLTQPMCGTVACGTGGSVTDNRMPYIAAGNNDWPAYLVTGNKASCSSPQAASSCPTTELKKIGSTFPDPFELAAASRPNKLDNLFQNWFNNNLNDPWIFGVWAGQVDSLTGLLLYHPHLGMTVAKGDPIRSAGCGAGCTYADTKFYAKYQLHDYLYTLYSGNLTNLNTAWGTSYTTFGCTGDSGSSTAICTSNQGVDNVAVGGTYVSGTYTTTATFSGGGCSVLPTGAAVLSTTTVGAVSSITITTRGSGCTSPPTVVVGGTGTGQTFTSYLGSATYGVAGGGTGFMDEDGTHIPNNSTGGCDDNHVPHYYGPNPACAVQLTYSLGNTLQQNTDLSNFATLLARSYFKQLRAAATAVTTTETCLTTPCWHYPLIAPGVMYANAYDYAWNGMTDGAGHTYVDYVVTEFTATAQQDHLYSILQIPVMYTNNVTPTYNDSPTDIAGTITGACLAGVGGCDVSGATLCAGSTPEVDITVAGANFFPLPGQGTQVWFANQSQLYFSDLGYWQATSPVQPWGYYMLRVIDGQNIGVCPLNAGATGNAAYLQSNITVGTGTVKRCDSTKGMGCEFTPTSQNAKTNPASGWLAHAFMSDKSTFTPPYSIYGAGANLGVIDGLTHVSGADIPFIGYTWWSQHDHTLNHDTGSRAGSNEGLFLTFADNTYDGVHAGTGSTPLLDELGFTRIPDDAQSTTGTVTYGNALTGVINTNLALDSGGSISGYYFPWK